MKECFSELSNCLRINRMNFNREGFVIYKNLPFSVISSHQLILRWVRWEHPSERAFSDKSVMAAHDPRSKRWSLEQCFDSDWQVLKKRD